MLFFGAKKKRTLSEKNVRVNDPRTNISHPNSLIKTDIQIYLVDVSLKALVKSPVEISNDGKFHFESWKIFEMQLTLET